MNSNGYSNLNFPTFLIESVARLIEAGGNILSLWFHYDILEYFEEVPELDTSIQSITSYYVFYVMSCLLLQGLVVLLDLVVLQENVDLQVLQVHQVKEVSKAREEETCQQVRKEQLASLEVKEKEDLRDLRVLQDKEGH